jgi:hypothetical protein
MPHIKMAYMQSHGSGRPLANPDITHVLDSHLGDSA